MSEEVAAKLAEDRKLYGASFERVNADGTRHRLDPTRIVIKMILDCEKCNGRGWVTVPFPVLGAPHGYDPPCADCNGTGKVR